MEYFDLMKEFSELNPNQEEEMTMNTTKSPVEMIKNELCSRYGINPEQIVINVQVDELESVELADQIRKDYAVEGKVLTFLRGYEGYNQHINDINHHSYVACADHGSNARKENILNVDIRTKNGVLKHD
jgi:two-component SAPR family response regulator